MNIETALQKINDLPLSAGIRENASAFPLLESLHVLAIAIVFGTILIVDLRLFGVASHRRSAQRLTAELLPYTWVAFVVAAITGTLMFMSNPVSYANNTQFLVKLGFIALAGLNMIWFHSTAYRRIAEWDEDMPPPTAARISGALSFILWTTVIFLGRWIGFTLETLFF
ncbi:MULTISPECIES: DUF6644 family protein [Novosphingobium]|uniref:DUF6644 domain-containing protein n=1 Tax=Novosphingobium mathurense TaxID=428990 RepID=A0A1U6HGN2_9SPHN|nr:MULTISPECIES: DUF6644 family protein [Novosphingobium]CDO38673.1 conserved membrane hypothetical protein [Novosphingobium sp. KN65.2]SLJ94953.1 hypothetical protein SAMN06295987_102363 [Novosphingobium mathurense]